MRGMILLDYTKILSITNKNTALLLIAYMADIPVNIIYTNNDNVTITVFSAYSTSRIDRQNKTVDRGC